MTATRLRPTVRSTGPVRPLRVCLVGAPEDTDNLGVTALSHAIIVGLAARMPSLDLTVFDNGFGVRWADGPWSHGGLRYRQVGFRLSRRFYRPESLTRVRASAMLGGLGNPAARAIEMADAVLDISGGDSFADLYGGRRYRMITEPKRLVLARGRPLVLLPQTYGPFSNTTTEATATRILEAATMAWARDQDSYSQLQTMLGESFDPARHRRGVDVAFRLPPTPAADRLDTRLRGWLAEGRATPTMGLNVSGLLYNDPVGDGARFGLRVSYPGMIRALVRRLLDETDANIVLVPHVLGSSRESDEAAAVDVLARVPQADRSRVALAPAYALPGQAKWLIGKLDWFCGTRMHATIAALSSGVPSAAIAYSYKTRGVFASCGLGEEVADARGLGEREVVARLLDSWWRRGQVRETLAAHLPGALHCADEQMDVVVNRVDALARHAGGVVS